MIEDQPPGICPACLCRQLDLLYQASSHLKERSPANIVRDLSDTGKIALFRPSRKRAEPKGGR